MWHSRYKHMCVCVCPLQSAPNFEDSPSRKHRPALQSQRTSFIHRLATELRNGEEMGRTGWVGSKLSAFSGEDTIFIYSIQPGHLVRGEMEWGEGVRLLRGAS